MKYCVYDLETIKNLFTGCFLDVETGKRKEFVIFDNKEILKDLVTFLKRLKNNDYYLVGFNNLGFDAQILEHILCNSAVWLANPDVNANDIVESIYQKAQEIIRLQNIEKFPNLIPEWKLSIPQIDLFKQKHYDGTAKLGTSLKWIQFSMRYHTVEEMPIEHSDTVVKEQVEQVLSYNWNDVESTAAFFKLIQFETDLRLSLSEKYNLNLLNASEPRLAKSIFGKFLCEDMGIQMKQLRDMKTYRDEIHLKDVIFPYIKFETPELQQILKAIKEVVVRIGEKDSFKHTFNYGGIKTDIGLGGIHACCSPGVYSSSEKHCIHDIDVVSFYPRLAIVNNVKPAHLGDSFSKIYNDVFEKRISIPKKDPINYVYKIILNSTYGLSKEINSYLYDPFFTYSITINGQLSLLMLVESLVREIPGLKIYQENTDGASIGYEPKYSQRVADVCKSWCEITGLELEHAFYKKMIIRDVNNYIAVKEDFNWDEYQSYVKEGKRKEYSKIKRKGIFEIDLDYHKNPSFIVVPMAAEAYFCGGKNYRQFIENHDNIFDFCAAVKRKSTFDLNLYYIENYNPEVFKSEDEIRKFLIEHGWIEQMAGWGGGDKIRLQWFPKNHPAGTEGFTLKSALALEQKNQQWEHDSIKKEKQQKVTRFYISNKGGMLIKDFKDGRKVKRVAVVADWKVGIANVINDHHTNNYPDLERTYYFKEAEKLISSVEGNTNQLELRF